MNIYPYVYRLEHPITGEFYIGFRFANKNPAEEDLGYKYFTSSKYVKPRFHEFNSQIIAIFFDEDAAYDFEQSLIIENQLNEKMLNRHFTHLNKRRYINKGGYTLSEETKLKMKKRTCTDELREVYRIKSKEYQTKTKQLEKLSQSRRGIPRTEEVKQKISVKNLGKKRTEETKQKLAEIARNISEETRNKYRLAKLGKKHPKVVCRIFDRKEMPLGSYKKWLTMNNL